MTPEKQDNTAMSEKAAEWFFALPKADGQVQAAFGAWLKESPRHVEEFLLVTAAYGELDHVSARIPIDLTDLREGLRTGVIALPGMQPEIVTRSSKPILRQVSASRRLAIAAAVSSIALAAAWLTYAAFMGGERYSTTTGEIRSLELKDGSLIQLNTRSQVKVEFSTGGRDIELLAGEALFKVARDPSRPFRVHAGPSVIQAVGTEFNVYRREQVTTVSVLEGKVRVLDSDNPAPGASATASTLSMGEEASIAVNGRISRLAKADVAKAMAWRERRLVFRGDSLEEVAAQFNRYNRAPKIRIEGKRARAKPLAGIFDADDPQSLVQFLAGVGDLKTERYGDELIVLDR